MSDLKRSATEFLRLAASGEAREAFRRYVGVGFRHHNPYFAGDADSLMNAMAQNAVQNPHKTLEVKHAIEEGDLVAVHAHVRFQAGDRGIALVHLFRFEGDRIVELWDLGQEVPEISRNDNGMF